MASPLSASNVQVNTRQRLFNPEYRLSLPPPIRILGGTLAGAGAGMLLGAVQSGSEAAYRYRAENAHRLPTSTKGWYFYHKTKNYVVMLGAIKRAFTMAPYVGFWSGFFFWNENLIDQWRGGGTHKDVLSTVVAAMAVSGFFSLSHRLPLKTATKTAKMGLVFGLGYGLLEDCIGTLQGREIGYIRSIRDTVSRQRANSLGRSL